MFIIEEDNTIHLTRGDIAAIEIRCKDKSTGGDYTFKTGDVVRLTVVKKKRYDSVVLKKDVVVNGSTTVVDMMLDTNDTRFGEVISKPTEYYYEIELNPDTAPQTIIGHDNEDGAKFFILYPEGGEKDV